MRESILEQKFVTACKRMNWECWKLTSPGRRGVPDRLVIAQDKVAFVELKAKGGKFQPLQRYYLQMLNNFGHFTAVVDSEDAVLVFIASFSEYLRTGNKENTIEVRASQLPSD